MEGEIGRSVPESLTAVAIEDVFRKDFNEAASGIFFLVVAFEFNKELLMSILGEIGKLSLDEQRMIYEIFPQGFEWAVKLQNNPDFNQFEKESQFFRTTRLKVFLLNYFSEAAAQCHSTGLREGVTLYLENIFALKPPIEIIPKDSEAGTEFYNDTVIGQTLKKVKEQVTVGNVFDQLCDAYNNHKWGDVLKVKRKLKSLDYDDTFFSTIGIETALVKDLSGNFFMTFEERNLNYRILSVAESGIKIIAQISNSGMIEVKSAFGSLKRRLEDRDLFGKKEELSFGIPFEQEKPTVIADGGMINMQVYPGLEKAKIVVTLRIDQKA